MQDREARDPDGEVPWNPAATAAFWINQASRLLLRRHEGRLRPLGFGMSQLPVLFALEDGAALPQKDLAKVARVEQPTMAEMIARMERDGVVERAPNPSDRRGSLVSLTRRSRVRLPKAKAALWQGERDAMAGFSEKEKTTLLVLLRRIVTNLDREQGAPSEGSD